MSELAAREAASLMGTYRRVPVTFVRGEGVWLYDDAGRAYLDGLAGIAVVSVGHANPRVADAVCRQMGELVHVSNLFYTEPQVALAERLVETSGMDKVFFANSGAEANEAAIKLVRRFGQERGGPSRHRIVSLEGSFHGRTLATLAATGQPDKQARFAPLPEGFVQVPATIDALDGAIDDTVAGVLIETIQGEGGVRPLPSELLLTLRRLCDDRGAVLIVDDVQAGVGRTGSWWSWGSDPELVAAGWRPDVVTSAKALANGLPVGAAMAIDEVAAAFEPGDHATTFGGGPVVCQAALATLEEIRSGGLLARAARVGRHLAAALRALDGVVDVRGRGLLLGAVLAEPRAAEATAAALEEGLVVNAVRPDTVRFTPPLVLSAAEADEAAARFGRALRRVF